jgi:hypothetical protein
MGNTVIVGAEMEATPIGAPARIVTVGSRQTRPLISPSLEKSLIRIRSPAPVRSIKMWHWHYFSDSTRPIYADATPGTGGSPRSVRTI